MSSEVTMSIQFNNVNDYINYIAPFVTHYSRAEYNNQQADYDYAGMIIAQSIVESWKGNRLSDLASVHYNFFGMKPGASWQGDIVDYPTKEYIDGQYVTIHAYFRSYGNTQGGIYGYFNFINSYRYENLKTATSAEDYAYKIKADGYATDPDYAAALIDTYYRYNLSIYDNAEPGDIPPDPPIPDEPPVPDTQDFNILPAWYLAKIIK